MTSCSGWGGLRERLNYFADRDPAGYAQVRGQICEYLGWGPSYLNVVIGDDPGFFETYLDSYIHCRRTGFPILAMPKIHATNHHAGPSIDYLPQRTRDYLEHGKQEGERNDELFAAACQFRDAGFTQDDAAGYLGPRAEKDGLSQAEIFDTIRSAYDRAPREPIFGKNGETAPGSAGSPKTRAARAAPAPLPNPIAEGLKVLLEICFAQGEYVAISDTKLNANGEAKPRTGDVCSRETWLKRLERNPISQIYPKARDGVFIRINPIAKNGKADKDVTALRHGLVEFDLDAQGNRIPKGVQYAALLRSELPFSAISDSGNKSIHGLVRVDAANRDEYDRRMEVIREYFQKAGLPIDPQNKNPSRYSRCPGVERNLYDKDGKLIGTGRQELLAVRLGAASWAAWEKHQVPSQTADTWNQSSSLPGIELSGDDNPVSCFARACGGIVAPHDFYWRMDQCMIPKTDEKGHCSLSAISPHEFRTHIENFCIPYKILRRRNRTKQVARSVSLEDARTTLVSRFFLDQLRPVMAFNLVRLPARYERCKIDLLPLGYDSHHKILTSQNALDYPLDIPIENAKRFLDELLAEFPFVAQDRLPAYSVVYAACLTPFCIHLLPPQTLRPAFLASANSEGSGKTLLWKIPTIALLGYAPIETIPGTEDEMRKTIASTVLRGSSIFFLDNIKGSVSSPSLESLITTIFVKFRLLGSNISQEIEHKTVVFMSANDARISPDLRRRLISIELFLEEIAPENRVITNPIGDDELVKLRPQILGSLWSLVKNWQLKGCPKGSVINQTFPTWSEVTGGILEAAGYPSPCKADNGINSTGDAVLNHMIKLVAKLKFGIAYDVPKLVSIARHNQLFEWLVGTVDDPPELEPKNRSRFGWLLKRFSGRTFPNKIRFQLVSKTDRKIYSISQI